MFSSYLSLFWELRASENLKSYNFVLKASDHVKILIYQTWPIYPNRGPGTFRARKAIFSSSVSENREMYKPEISFVKRTSVYVNNTWIKQLSNHKLQDFAMAFRVRKLFGTFEKRAPGFKEKLEFQLALRTSSSQILLAPGQVLLSLFNLVGAWFDNITKIWEEIWNLTEPFPIGQVKMKRYLPSGKIYNWTDNWTALFSSPTSAANS